MPSISRGLNGSPVLVDGRTFTPATGAGATVGAAAAAVVADGAAVGVTVATGAAVGATVAEGATVNGGRVGGMNTVCGVHEPVMNVSLINVTFPLRASARPWTVTPL